MPGYVPPQPTTSTLIPTAPAFNPPTGPAAFQNRAGPAATQQNGNVNGTGEQSRKRRFREGSESREDTHYSQRGTGDRLTKQMRRGGSRGGTLSAGIGRAGPLPAQSQIALPGMSSPPGAPGFPAGLPPFDPSNPLAAVLAMQAAMGFLPFPGMSGSPTGFQQGAGNSLPPRKPGQRCRDYDTKGFCALGTACPYDHGQDHLVAPGQTEEYDPTNAKVDSFRSSNHSGYGDRNRGDRGRGRGRGSFGGKGRAAFSHAGPSFDKTNMKIVVEQIPEDKFSEQHIREFFSEFGEIEEVQLQPYKHLAIVKYNDHESAKRAYDSPKVIFDNRFVKVYWYKQDGLPNPNTARAPRDRSSSHNANQKPDEEMIDPEEFQRKQAEAQKAQDEKKKKLEEAEVQRKELERKMKEAAEARKKLLEKLAAKSAGSNGTPSSDPASKGGETDGSGATTASQTDTLKAKLAELEAEAASLGLPAEEQFQSGFRGRGRGGYRGRGGFPPRGRGFDPSRGSWRGRGAFSGAHRGGVMRLDNRPKKIAVTAPNLASGKDEAFRQYLFVSFQMRGSLYSRRGCAKVNFPFRTISNLKALNRTQIRRTHKSCRSRNATLQKW